MAILVLAKISSEDYLAIKKSADDYLASRSVSGKVERSICSNGCFGRAQQLKPVQMHMAAKEAYKTEGAPTVYQRQLRRLANRIEEMTSQVERVKGRGIGVLPQECSVLWTKVAKAGSQMMLGSRLDGAWGPIVNPKVEGDRGVDPAAR